MKQIAALMTIAQWWARITKVSFMKIIMDPDLATSLQGGPSGRGNLQLTIFQQFWGAIQYT